jgi:iron complex transport system substrate-binding protein
VRRHAALPTLLLAVAAAAATMAACHRAPTAPAAPVAARRLISLAPSSTEILYALGVGDRLVGVDQYSDWPPAAQNVPRVGNDLNPSIERILALKPDAVFVATSANTRDLAEQLGRLGVRVVVSRVDKLDELWSDIAAIGAAVDRQEAARALIASLRGRLARVAARVAAAPPVKTLVVVWADPLTVVGGGSFVDEAIRAAGGANVASDSPEPYPQYSVERMLARAPEVIVVGSHKGGPPLATLASYASMPAVRNHRVHPLDGDLLFRPGPRLADGIEALSRLLHP